MTTSTMTLTTSHAIATTTTTTAAVKALPDKGSLAEYHRMESKQTASINLN